ncbi:MAG: pantetheine-phosphate adenylyltransferase [Clostridiales bacterium]|nr:pantetheine-phosphate adenylyltransferase [Clostridiales bacterium]
MSSCVIPGSFDPVTRGHVDLIRRASRIFDRVTVVVMINIHKKGTFTPEERVSLLEKACRDIPEVRVDRWDGLLSAYMRAHGERTVVRGTRNGTEYDAETAAAQANRMLNPEMETLLMPAGEGLQWISASAVREIAAFGGEIREWIPAECAEEIEQRLSK